MGTTIAACRFGLTKLQDSMAERLTWLAESLVDQLSDGLQEITLEVSVAGQCPPRLRQSVLRIADALVGHAVGHGMVARPIGRIMVGLSSTPNGRTVLRLIHDGWGPCRPDACEALRLAGVIAARHDGQVRLEQGSMIMAQVDLFDGG